MSHHQIRLIALSALIFYVTAADCKAIRLEEPIQNTLRGVTVKNWPFIERQNGTFRGFLVDLMNEITGKLGSVKYELQYSSDSAYNTDYNYKLSRIVSEVFSNKADFALADLTVTDVRKRYVDFTEPFLESQLAIVVRKQDAIGLASFQDLVKYNLNLERLQNATKSVKNPTGTLERPIPYGTTKSRATIYKLSTSKDPTAVHIFNSLEAIPDAYGLTRMQGLENVIKGRYAFLVDSIYAEYVVGGKCNLTALPDTSGLYPRKYSIAVPKGSPHLLSAFNQALRELKASGVIERLRRHYWSNKCN